MKSIAKAGWPCLSPEKCSESFIRLEKSKAGNGRDLHSPLLRFYSLFYTQKAGCSAICASELTDQWCKRLWHVPKQAAPKTSGIPFGFSCRGEKDTIKRAHPHTNKQTHPLARERFLPWSSAHRRADGRPEVDIWAMGVICYGLLTGRFPFKASDGRIWPWIWPWGAFKVSRRL